MAPEKKNTARLSLDTIAAIKSLFGAFNNAHAILRPDSSGINVRRFTMAMQHRYVTQDEVNVIEMLWKNWRDHFMLPEHHNSSNFTLPDDLLYPSEDDDDDTED